MKMITALRMLNDLVDSDLVDSGIDFADALFRASQEHNVDAMALQYAYDEQWD